MSDDLLDRLKSAVRGGELAEARGELCAATIPIPDLRYFLDTILTLEAEVARLREPLQQFVNGCETGMIDSPADDILANVLRRAKAALLNPQEEEGYRLDAGEHRALKGALLDSVKIRKRLPTQQDKSNG